MTIEVTVGDAGEIQLVVDGLTRPKEILDAIGALMTGRAVKAFREQRRGESIWEERMTPNVPGIVTDLNKGTFPKARRFEPRPAVVDTGILRNSIGWQTAGLTVTVGTSVRYADVQNEGGTSEVTLTGTGRTQLTKWLRRERGAGRRASKLQGRLERLAAAQVGADLEATQRAIGKEAARQGRAGVAASLGWLFSKPSFEVQVRERRFLDVTRQDRSDIVELVERVIAKRARGR